MNIEQLKNLAPEQLEEFKRGLILRPLESAEELQAWMYMFFDILFPMGVVHPDSTHAPADAMWEIYNLMKTGKSSEHPQATMLSSRDSYKTLCAASLEVLCMVHFEIPVAHMAAIKSQSAKAIQYINGFFRKIRPYLEHHGWQKKSDSKTYIDWITPSGNTVWLNVVTATIAGANCIYKDSTVLTESGLKKAKDVKQGDLLKSFDIWTQQEILTEVMGASTLKSDSREIIFEDGSNLILSHKHKVFTQRGWLNAGTLKVGDKTIGKEEVYKTEYETQGIDPNWNLNPMVFGMLLGDASIQKLPSGSCRYQVFHTSDQLGYLKNIQKTFEKNNITSRIVPDRDGYKLYTQTHEFFKKAHDLCFIDGKKTVTQAWLANVDLEAIAFLIMDGGTIHRKKIGKYKENPIDIATLSFSDKENQLIIDKIKKLGYEASLHRFGKYNQIRLPIQSSRDISWDIERYFVDCLKYKLIRSDDIRFAVDSGKPIDNNAKSYGFVWQDKVLANQKKGREFRKNIKPFLNKKIIAINDVGVQELVGLTIKDDDFNKKSFFANGIFVHNSEHVPMLCVDGDTDIMCKNMNTKTNRVRRNKKAKALYKNFLNGKKDLVYTFNHETGDFEFKKIVKAFKQQKEVFRVQIEGSKDLYLSEDHPILSMDGHYKPLKDFSVGEKVLKLGRQQTNKNIDIKLREEVSWKKPTKNSDELEQLILGSLLGDGYAYKRKNNNAYIGWQHCLKQRDYAYWKEGILKKYYSTYKRKGHSGYTGEESFKVVSQNHKDFNEWSDFRKNIDDRIFKLNAFGLAIWFMDDGSSNINLELHTQSFSYKDATKLSEMLYKNFNIIARPYRVKNYHTEGEFYYTLRGNASEKKKLYEITKKYIHKDMLYKFDSVFDVEKECRFCKNTFMPFESSNTAYYCNSVLCRTIRVDQLKPQVIYKIESAGIRDVYDFTVEDNHNFFANQILVHNCIDEVDVVQDPRALKEAKMIPSVWGKYFPLTVYLSTRKFAGGLMEKTLDETVKAGGKILKWNILDVTERIPLDVAQADKPKVVRYVTSELPMHTITEEEWEKLPVETRVKYEKIEAYRGIADHPMLPVMRNLLVDRPQTDVGNLYKPLVAVHNNFKQTPADMAEAQLLCRKPSASGLVYPRFDIKENVLSVNEAIKKIVGEDLEIDSFEYLKDYIKNLGVPIVGGADWGFSDLTTMVVLAILPGGDVLHLETFAMSGLELDDIVKYGGELQEEWGVERWYVDQAYPAYIKTMKRKANWKVPAFKKVVVDGIAALQSKIVNSSNTRKYFVINTPNNAQVIKAFGKYRWALDGRGEVIEGRPHHGEDGTSDIMDAIRYPAQNLFIKGAKITMTSVGGKSTDVVKPTIEENKKMVESLNEKAMKERVKDLAVKDGISGVKKKGKIFWG